MSKKPKDDPFKNMNVEQLANLGKGDIFRLKVDETDRSIDEIEEIGLKKDKEKEDRIR